MKFFTTILFTAAIATKYVLANEANTTTSAPATEMMADSPVTTATTDSKHVIGSILDEISQTFGSNALAYSSASGSESGSRFGIAYVGDNSTSTNDGASIQMTSLAMLTILATIAAALL
ncbi:hypothetical protein CCR75_005967 [Bremia lactucae]|uniref:Secreted protein n=1 Tax=Bremia lactucae TaxID=4779 RepID=A0A976IDE8_BRELC|nr:hypothetical protein CCR75_005967 [Bremia lactucae]